jgi:hypothetical protein
MTKSTTNPTSSTSKGQDPPLKKPAKTSPTPAQQFQYALLLAAGRYEYFQRKASYQTQKAAEKTCDVLIRKPAERIKTGFRHLSGQCEYMNRKSNYQTNKAVKNAIAQLEHVGGKTGAALTAFLWKCWKNLQIALKIWTKLALTMRWRDRLVKIIQYGCQMLVGYWSGQLNKGLKAALVETRRTCSNARKAFWLLKTLNHLGDVQNTVDRWMKKKSLTLLECLGIVEQLAYGMYYMTENFVFFIRCKLLDIPEAKIDPYLNWSWFVGDMAGLISSSIKLHENTKLMAKKRRQSIEEEKLCKKLEQEEEDNGIARTPSFISKECTSDDDCWHEGELLTPKQIEARLRARKCCVDLETLKTQQFDLSLQLVIAIFEVGVSLHYVKGFRLINGGKDINDGHVGLMGVLSSGLILYEGYRNVALGDSP